MDDPSTSSTAMTSIRMQQDQSETDDDALAERLYDKLVARQGAEQSKIAKQGIHLLIASGLIQLYKERQSQPTSPDPAASPTVQSPAAIMNTPLYSNNTSPMSSISSAASASSSSSYGLPNHFRQRESSTASSVSAYSPATTHTRSFSSSSSSTSSPSLSSTPSLRRSAKRKAIKILDLGTGEHGTISTILTLMSEKGLIHPKEELEITASEQEKRFIEKLKEKFKGWNHVKLRAYAPESIPAKADTYHFVFNSMGIQWVRDEDSTLQETYRVLQPGGTAGFSSLQSIGYTSSGTEDPLKILPNSGWSDPLSIRKKLSKHHFTSIEIYECTFPHTWHQAHKTWKQVLEYIIDGAIKRLWKDENNTLAEMDEHTRCAMREQLKDMFKEGECNEDVVALITLAKKPELMTLNKSFF